jgi:hypothetical protein
MVYFPTKNANCGIFWKVFEWKILLYFMVICYVLGQLGQFFPFLVHFPPFWFVVPKKSGNPVFTRAGLFFLHEASPDL